MGRVAFRGHPETLSLQRGMPMLSYESDRYAVSPSVLRRVEAHVLQFLAHPAARVAQSWTISGLPKLLRAAADKLTLE